MLASFRLIVRLVVGLSISTLTEEATSVLCVANCVIFVASPVSPRTDLLELPREIEPLFPEYRS